MVSSAELMMYAFDQESADVVGPLVEDIHEFPGWMRQERTWVGAGRHDGPCSQSARGRTDGIMSHGRRNVIFVIEKRTTWMDRHRFGRRSGGESLDLGDHTRGGINATSENLEGVVGSKI